MNATLIIRIDGNTSSITIKRNRSFKIMHMAASEIGGITQRVTRFLESRGYRVGMIPVYKMANGEWVTIPED